MTDSLQNVAGLAENTRQLTDFGFDTSDSQKYFYDVENGKDWYNNVTRHRLFDTLNPKALACLVLPGELQRGEKIIGEDPGKSDNLAQYLHAGNFDFSRSVRISEIIFSKLKDKHSANRSVSHSADAKDTQRYCGPYDTATKGRKTVREPTVISRIRGQLKLRPIIIVPSVSSVISVSNVVKFLEDGAYEPVTGHETIQTGRLTVSKNIDDKIVKFCIVEAASVHKLKVAEWKAVVATIVSDHDWQFAKWPFKSIQHIFAAIKGFYFCLNGSTVPGNVLNWKAKVLSINPNNKSNNITSQVDFWATIQEFLRSRQPMPEILEN